MVSLMSRILLILLGFIFFAGHVAGSRPTKRKKNLHQMITSLACIQTSWKILQHRGLA